MEGLLDELKNVINENIQDSNYGIADICKRLGLSHMQLYRRLKKMAGMTPKQFIRQIKMEEATKLLKDNPNLHISEVAYKVGFNDPSYFTRVFHKIYNESPSQYQLKARPQMQSSMMYK